MLIHWEASALGKNFLIILILPIAFYFYGGIIISRKEEKQMKKDKIDKDKQWALAKQQLVKD